MRRPRNELPPEGIYHVTTRGSARTATFRTDDEYRFFLRLLTRVVEQHEWRMHGFCLMPNWWSRASCGVSADWPWAAVREG